MTPIAHAIIVLLVAQVVPQLLFVIRYGWFSPWRATWQGITLMAQTATLGALVTFFIYDTIVVGEWPGRSALLLGFLGLLAVESWAALWGLIHVQRSTPPVSERQGTGYVHPDNIEGHTDD